LDLLHLRVAFADHPVAAGAFGCVEASVGALDQRCHRFAGAQRRHPDRYRDSSEMLSGGALHQFLGHHRAANVIGHGDCRAQDCLREDDGELLSAVARGDVLAFDVLLHGDSHKAQHLVSGEMAVAVVEVLEMVDVDHQK
jgi:hypothetical protein